MYVRPRRCLSHKTKNLQILTLEKSVMGPSDFLTTGSELTDLLAEKKSDNDDNVRSIKNFTSYSSIEGHVLINSSNTLTHTGQSPNMFKTENCLA